MQNLLMKPQVISVKSMIAVTLLRNILVSKIRKTLPALI